MGLYEQIRDIAREKGYSINKLEQELGFARSSINKFNKNRPSLDKIQKIADFLDVSVDYLMTGKDSHESGKADIDYLVKLGDDEFLLEMMAKAKKLENEHDKELIMTMLDTMISKNRKK